MSAPLTAALLGVMAAALVGQSPATRPAASARVHAVVVGTVQDGGLPHLGCHKECCELARRDPSRARRVASLALIIEGSGPDGRKVLLIDATPDLRSQLDEALGEAGRRSRPPGLPLDGILLTHAHIGHYTGLMYLGMESVAARGVPVHATARMVAFLRANGPWSRLVQGGHIELRVMEPGRDIALAPGLSVRPLRVPHREEESDVVGFLVTGPSRRLLYLPDVDAWERWDRDIARQVAGVDVALLDGTFFSSGELGSRSMEAIPHPLIGATMDRLEPVVKKGHRVIFIHLNHSNPALRPGTAERLAIERRGFEVASEGLDLPL